MSSPLTIKEVAEVWGVTLGSAKKRVYNADLVAVGERINPRGGRPAKLYRRADLNGIAPTNVCPTCKRVLA